MDRSSSAQNKKLQELTEESVKKLMMRMALPTMIGMLVSSIYNTADTFFIGMLHNKVYTAAIGIAFSFMSIIQAVGFLFGHGSGNYISEKIGKKEIDKAKQMAANGFLLSFASGILIMIAGLLNIHSLAILLGARGEVIQPVCTYLRIILYGTPASIVSFTINNQLRLQGSAKDGMLGMLVGMIFNAVFDPILMIACNLGIAGIGWATFGGQVLSMIALFFITWKKGNIGIDLRGIQLSGKRTLRILKGGLPNFSRQGITSAASMLFNNIISAAFDPAVVAAFGIVVKILAIGQALVIGFGHGFQPICGVNYSARKYTRVREAFVFCVKITTVFLVIVTIVFGVFSETFVGLFTTDAQTIEVGSKILSWQTLSMPLLGYYTLVGMMLQNTGRFYLATIVSIARQGLFYIPVLLIASLFDELNYLIAVQPVADVMSFIFAILLVMPVMKELRNASDSGKE